MKKLIIVCDEKTQAYANYLTQLISLNDDKEDTTVGLEDGTVESVVWLEKEYKANRPQLSSNSYILFIGNNKEAKLHRENIEIKFNRFGMQYGWLGKTAALYVDNHVVTSKEYQNFFEYAQTYKEKLDKVLQKTSKQKVAKEVALAGALAIGGGAIALGAIEATRFLLARKDIRKQQYSCAIITLYLEGLEQFLEG